MGNGTEVGVAYVSLVPTAKGFGAAVASQIGAPVQAAAVATGGQASKGLSTSFLGGLQGVGAKALGFLGFAGIAAGALKSAVDVQDAQNIILRSTGATGKAAESLTSSFKSVAASSPAAFGTVATVLSELSQRTGLTGSALEGLTKQVVTFNRITKDSPLDVQELTKALAGFNVPASQMGVVLDKLFTTSQKTGVPLADLIGTLNSAGPIARQFGFSVQFTAGLLAQLNKAGVDANSIMPGLRKAFIQFAKDGREPADALKETLGQMDALIKKGDEAEARQIAVQLFGGRGVGLVDAAVQGKLSLQDLSKTFDTTGKGILETASTTGTLSGKLGVLKNQATLAFAAFGTPFLSAATEGLKDALPVVGALGSGLAKLQPALEPAILGFVTFLGTTKLLVPALGLLQRGLLQATLGLGQIGASGGAASGALAASANGIGRFGQALPGLAVGGVLVASSFNEMGKSALPTAQGIAGMAIAGGALGSVIPGVGTALGAAAGAAIGFGASMGNALVKTRDFEGELKELQKAAADVQGPTAGLVLKFEQVISAAGKADTLGLNPLGLRLFAFKQVAEQNVGVAARLAEQFPKTSATYRGMEQILKKLVAAHNENVDAQGTEAASLQNITGMVDETTDSYKAAAAAFGAWGAGALAVSGVAESEMTRLAESSKRFAESLEGSISSATDPFSHFASAASVGVDEFEQFFVDSEQRAGDWAREIQDLVGRGVNEGILQQIAQAGPSSKPALDAFVQVVDEKGVEWVNSISASGQAAAAETEKAFNAMIVTTAIQGARRNQLQAAVDDELKTGTTAKLEELLASSDKTLAQMAFGAILQLGGIKDAVNGLPTSHEIDVIVNAAFNGQVGSLSGLAALGGGDAIMQQLIDFLNSLGQPRALGGSVSAGKRFLVGEEGPEIFEAPADGRIIPNSQLRPVRAIGTAAGASAGVVPLIEGGLHLHQPIDDPISTAVATARNLRAASVLAGL